VILHSASTLTGLCLSALVAGAVNSLAGGGTLLTFPVLIAALSPSLGRDEAAVVANATSTVAGRSPGRGAIVAKFRRRGTGYCLWQGQASSAASSGRSSSRASIQSILPNWFPGCCSRRPSYFLSIQWWAVRELSIGWEAPPHAGRPLH
jgi:hypothetical protein